MAQILKKCPVCTWATDKTSGECPRCAYSYTTGFDPNSNTVITPQLSEAQRLKRNGYILVAIIAAVTVFSVISYKANEPDSRTVRGFEEMLDHNTTAKIVPIGSVIGKTREEVASVCGAPVDDEGSQAIYQGGTFVSFKNGLADLATFRNMPAEDTAEALLTKYEISGDALSLLPESDMDTKFYTYKMQTFTADICVKKEEDSAKWNFIAVTKKATRTDELPGGGPIP